jgi:uncharacterized membrane protein YhaH (DUF805 family)
MFGYLDFLFFSYSGRIGRMPYWLGTLVIAVIQYIVGMWVLNLAMPGVMELVADNPEVTLEVFQEIMLRTVAPVGIISLVFMWPTYAIYTKRWHDRGKSGWWSLIIFIPIIGPIWMFIECGFLAGEEGTNSYGPNPAYA